MKPNISFRLFAAVSPDAFQASPFKANADEGVTASVVSTPHQITTKEAAAGYEPHMKSVCYANVEQFLMYPLNGMPHNGRK